jgi:hypothetical protein
LQYQQLKNKLKCAPNIAPPANMAIPWFRSEVDARDALASLSREVVKLQSVALKMSTTILALREPCTAHVQRISIHIRPLKASLLPHNK